MKSDSWLTPREWIDVLGEFDLDPACPVDMPWKTAKTMLTEQEDGLSVCWFGRVWLNPPFGRDADKWLRKMAQHGNGIALIPARTETKMFYEHVWDRAHAICFVKGRPHFHYKDGSRAPFNSGAPIALIAYGEENVVPLVRSRLGVVVYTWSRPCAIRSRLSAEVELIGRRMTRALYG